MLEVLRKNSTAIADEWMVETSRAPFTKAVEMPFATRLKSESLHGFLDAVLARLENPESKKTLRMSHRIARIAHLSGVELESVVDGYFTLRNIMTRVLFHNLPEELREPARSEIDEVISRCVKEFAKAHEDLIEMQLWLTKNVCEMPMAKTALDQAMTRFCRSAMDYFDTDFVALFTYEADTNELVCEGSSAKGVAMTRGTRVLLSAFPLAEAAIKGRQPRMSPLGEGESHSRTRAMGNLSFARLMAVPTVKGNAVYGLLFVGDTADSPPFYPDEIRIAEEMGGLIATIQDNMQHLGVLSLMSRAQKALIETAATLQQEIESKEIYRIVADKLAELIPCDELMFYVFDWRRNVGNPVYATGPYAAEIMADKDFPAGVGIVGSVAKSRKAEIVLDTETDPRGEHIPDTPETHSRMLAVPILGRKEVLGVIELLKYPPDTFTQEDLEIATMFAYHAAAAIENARLIVEITAARDMVELHQDLIAHDLANYATPIAAYLAELRDRKDLDPKIGSIVEKTLVQLECIEGLVEMARTTTRMRRGGSGPPKRLDLRDAIEHATSRIGRWTIAKGLEFDLQLPAGPIGVLGDDLLRDLFFNFFVGARMSDPEGHIHLVVSAEPAREAGKNYWLVKVSQHGRGLPEKLKADTQGVVRTSRSELAGGFGSAIVAVNSIVERYSGRAWVSDIEKGDPSKGWALNMMLPRAS